MRWTEEQLAYLQNRSPVGPKYRNKPEVVDGIRFASKREAKTYLELKFMLAAGQIRGFTRQVSLPLASGKRRMIIDFMVVNLDGSIRWIDAKGVPTEAWSVKRDELEHSLGIKIETV